MHVMKLTFVSLLTLYIREDIPCSQAHLTSFQGSLHEVAPLQRNG